jgi:Protein of unknown function (DUF3551)
MKTGYNIAGAALIAASGLAGIAMSSSAAQAGPIVPRGHYCLWYAEGGTDCSFTSYQQCQATTSGIAAECYGNTARDDAEDSRTFGWSPHRAGRY